MQARLPRHGTGKSHGALQIDIMTSYLGLVAHGISMAHQRLAQVRKPKAMSLPFEVKVKGGGDERSRPRK